MYREIKFRAWVKNTYFYPDSDGVERDHIEHKMIDSFTMREDASVIFEPLSAITWEKPRYTWEEDKRKIISVMQYTGLKDKNGKEIYEGDILQSEYNSHEKNSCHPVVWGDGKWAVDHSINDCCKPWRGDLAGHHRSETIIGNIYENPELLK